MSSVRGRTTLIAGVVLVVILALPALPLAAAQAPSSSLSSTNALGQSFFDAGYSGNVTTGTTYTKVSATWNLPTVTCQPGLGSAQQLVIFVQANVLMAGVREFCPKGGAVPSITPFAYLPPVNPSIIKLPLAVSPGDILQVFIKINPSTDVVVESMTNTNTSAGASATAVVPEAGATAQGLIIAISRGLVGSPFHAVHLAEYSPSIKFRNCFIVQSGTKVPLAKLAFVQGFNMVDSSFNLMAKTSALSNTGMAFRTTWVSST